MVKLSGRKEVHPFPRVVGTEDVKICFNLLIGPFGLSICLRVICGGELDIIVEESCQFSSKGECELWVFVRYQGIMESKSFEHMGEEKLATPAASMVFVQGMRITPFLREVDL